jgi:hypothetical protein
MIAYAKSIQIYGNFPGDDYYLDECWRENFNDGMTPEESVDSDMGYWEPEE